MLAVLLKVDTYLLSIAVTTNKQVLNFTDTIGQKYFIYITHLKLRKSSASPSNPFSESYLVLAIAQGKLELINKFPHQPSAFPSLVLENPTGGREQLFINHSVALKVFLI